MAKKTAKKSPAKNGAPKKKKPAATKGAKKAAPKKPASAPAPPYGAEQIGLAAGEVWSALNAGGPQTIAALKKASKGSAEQTLMAIGWLAREGKLDFTTSGRSVKVSLR